MTIKANEIHEMVCEAAVDAGGRRCEELLHAADGQKLADIAFLNHETVVEIKVLDADRTDMETVRIKLGKVYKRWADEGRVPKRRGSFDVNFKDVPRDLMVELIDVIGKRIKTVLRRANLQIRDTAQRLGFSNPIGLVILVVPGHFGTDGAMVSSAAIRNLSKETLRSINGGVSLELWTEAEPQPDRLMYAAPFSSPGRIRPSMEIVHKICISMFMRWGEYVKANVLIVPLDKRR